MMVGFQCPYNGVPLIGEWDEDSGILTFDLENETEAREHVPAEEVEEAISWCKRRESYCSSEEEANAYLGRLGVSERLGVW